MGFANLNVCISERDPFSISLKNWSVIVTDYSGRSITGVNQRRVDQAKGQPLGR
jgi:hypothetical protein